MKIAAILLIVLVVGSNASMSAMFEKYPLNFSSKRSIMTLLTQVEAKLKAGGPLDSITKQLDEFQTTITEEQANHDRLYDAQVKECADESGFRDREISDSTAALKEAQETLDGCNAQNVRANSDWTITKQQLQDNRSYLALIEDTRRRESSVFEAATEVYQHLTKAIDEALVILEEIWGGETNFAQLAKHANGMLKTAVKIRKAHMMSSIMGALAQMANSKIEADEGFLQRVNGMLNNFRDRVVDDFQTAAAAEDASVSNYNADKSRLQGTIEHLVSQQEGLENELNALQKCIVTQSGIVNSATAKRDRNQRLLDDADALCGSVDQEYTSSTQARKNELELLGAIRERVEARFAEIAGGVRNEDDLSYHNASEYENDSFGL